MSIIFDATHEDYHSDNVGLSKPSLNNSIANVLLNDCPAKARLMHPKLNLAPARDEEGDEEGDDSAPTYLERQVFHNGRLDLGRAAHLALLGGQGGRFEVVDAPDWRGKAAKALRVAARGSGDVPVLKSQHSQVVAMAAAARAYWDSHQALHAFAEGRTEVVVTSVNRHGDDCRSMLDWVCISGNTAMIVDYKTVDSLQPEYLNRHVFNYGYHMQLAFYSRRLYENMIVHDRRYLLCQEIRPPYLCRLVAFEPLSESVAERMVDKAEQIWHECLSSGVWPSYPREPMVAAMEDWRLKQSSEFV